MLWTWLLLSSYLELTLCSLWYDALRHNQKTRWKTGNNETPEGKLGVVRVKAHCVSTCVSLTQRRQCTSGWRSSWIRSHDIDTLPGISWQLDRGMSDKSYLLYVCVEDVFFIYTHVCVCVCVCVCVLMCVCVLSLYSVEKKILGSLSLSLFLPSLPLKGEFDMF